MSEVIALPVSGYQREHVTVAIDAWASSLADAQIDGFCHALDVLQIFGIARHEMLHQYADLRDLRAKLYAAQLRVPISAER